MKKLWTKCVFFFFFLAFSIIFSLIKRTLEFFSVDVCGTRKYSICFNLAVNRFSHAIGEMFELVSDSVSEEVIENIKVNWRRRDYGLKFCLIPKENKLKIASAEMGTRF